MLTGIISKVSAEMTEEKIEAVAALLAKVGSSWFPERTRPALRTISKRHRDVAQLILSEIEQSEGGAAAKGKEPDDAEAYNFAGEGQFYVGATVVYRPPGEKRAITCRIDRIERGRAFLVPAQREIGWVSTEALQPAEPEPSDS